MGNQSQQITIWHVKISVNRWSHDGLIKALIRSIHWNCSMYSCLALKYKASKYYYRHYSHDCRKYNHTSGSAVVPVKIIPGSTLPTELLHKTRQPNGIKPSEVIAPKQWHKRHLPRISIVYQCLETTNHHNVSYARFSKRIYFPVNLYKLNKWVRKGAVGPKPRLKMVVSYWSINLDE